MLQLTFLGTSAGIPTPERNTSAIALECRTREQGRAPWLLIDCGEATQHQIQKSHLKPSMLQAILITHAHGDHCFGLPGLLASLSQQQRSHPLLLIAPLATLHFIQSAFDNTDTRLKYPLETLALEVLMSQDKPIHTIKLPQQHISITPCALSHRIPSHAYLIQQHLPNLNPHQINPPQSIIIAGDNDSPERLNPIISQANILVHEATYTQTIENRLLARPIPFNPQHTTAKRIAQYAQSQLLPNLILTHFSSRYPSHAHAKKPSILDIQQEAKQYYKGNLFLAQDFASYHIDGKEVTPVEQH